MTPDQREIPAGRDEARMNKYIVSYRHAGSEWLVDIYADSWAEAELKVQNLRGSAEVVGQSIADFPAWMPMWMARIWMWLQQ